MTITNFRVLLASKSSGRLPITEDVQLFDRIFDAMKRVAYDTIPLTLVVKKKNTRPMLRRIDSETWIMIPEKPVGANEDKEELDIDETLTDAVAYHVMAGLEQQRAKQFMGLYWTEIDHANSRLVETYLAVASNDAERFHQFP